MRKTRGFTLVELMVTVLVLAIAVGLAWPSYQNVIRSNRITSTNNEFITLISYARTESIRNSRGSGLCLSQDGTQCDGGFADGWIVWPDLNANRTKDADEQALRVLQANPAMVFEPVSASSPGSLVFDPRGRISDNTPRIYALRPTDCKSATSYQRTITILASGQTRVERSQCP
ncbi:MAG: pre-pilin like leader sequence [Pseudoxanthomonas suwonensis]|nr:MAG: pre-pilin like leader sequence [Pseudoxanthomonas suwonensis]